VLPSFEFLRNKWSSFTMCCTFKILLRDMHGNYCCIVCDFHIHSYEIGPRFILKLVIAYAVLVYVLRSDLPKLETSISGAHRLSPKTRVRALHGRFSRRHALLRNRFPIYAKTCNRLRCFSLYFTL
jgi:hypothetical protein